MSFKLFHKSSSTVSRSSLRVNLHQLILVFNFLEDIPVSTETHPLLILLVDCVWILLDHLNTTHLTYVVGNKIIAGRLKSDGGE